MMFCNQCEQTANGTGCTKMGVCGKTPDVAAVQDVLVYASRGLALAILAAAAKGADINRAGRVCVAALFSTITNVNFDKADLRAVVDKVVAERKRLVSEAGLALSAPAAVFEPAKDEAALLEQAKNFMTPHLAPDADRTSLAQTLLYGLKGVAAYTDHAAILGEEDRDHYLAFCRGLAFGFDGTEPALGDWVGAVLECGNTNLKAMELLDTANTGTYGHPEPTEVALRPRPGKAILVTGHDLKDLYELLVQTEGTGVNIYTHGEMLPTLAYPGLKKFSHFAGHFGTAWQNQVREFPRFPGAILFTTNCIQRPAAVYHDNVFTTGLVGWPGVTHVKNGNFGPVIERALSLPGFTEEEVQTYPDTKILVGFGRNTVMSVAGTVVEAVKSGAIRRFFLVGGCDGAKPGRNYYTEFVEKAPKDTVVLTLACGKFRFFDKKLGDIGGIPRLLDCGQCNDAYSAVKIAQALAGAFSCGVNDLPLSIILSWYEQKAVAVLLSLLALGVKGIRLGPTLPAFVTPAVLNVLVENFDIKPIAATADEDLQTILA